MDTKPLTVLVIPAADLPHLVAVIRAGLGKRGMLIPPEVRRELVRWCEARGGEHMQEVDNK